MEQGKHFHFIGIGGISMSGLAEILITFGHKVSGSDLNSSNLTHKLESMGVVFYQGHDESNIKNPDVVVYTAAIKSDNPELIRARALNIPIIDRASLLGLIMGKYPYSIAISGTHGKTTTSSMIAVIMVEAGLDPTVHIGGELDCIGGATKVGKSDIFIAEACEYCDSFLKLSPYISIILNIDYDHADYFKDIEQMKGSFLNFAKLVREDGFVISCIDDVNASSLLKDISANKITYGMESNTNICTWGVGNVLFDSLGCASFTLFREGKIFDTVRLKVPGMHNVYNSLAAIAASHLAGCSISQIKQGLEKFTGTHRRFELKGFYKGTKIIEDYAHHPSEVKVSLKTAKQLSYPKIWCVFQPHTFTRTKVFLEDFANSFFDADIAIIADIYAAREKDNKEVSSKLLAEKINTAGGRALYIGNFQAIVNHLKQNLSPGDLLLVMGAGDIYKVGDMLIEES